jgi:hypothetical protein
VRAVVLVLEGNNIRLVHLALGAIINPEQRERKKKKKREHGAVSATRCRGAAAESGGPNATAVAVWLHSLGQHEQLGKGFRRVLLQLRRKQREGRTKKKKGNVVSENA